MDEHLVGVEQSPGDTPDTVYLDSAIVYKYTWFSRKGLSGADTADTEDTAAITAAIQPEG
jgi:hypothetical protein